MIEIKQLATQKMGSDPQAGQDGSSVKYAYDKKSNKIREDWSNGAFSEFKYDDRGRLLAVTGTHERNTESVYNRAGRLTEERDFGLPRAQAPRITKYFYDKAGRQGPIRK